VKPWSEPARAWAGGLALVASVAAMIAYSNLPPYGVGKSLAELGIPRSVVYTRLAYWSPRSRQTVKDYCKEMKIPSNDFTGVTILNKPDSELDECTLEFVDGKLDSQVFAKDDAWLKDDIEILKHSRLDAMLRGTRNDWRILEYKGKAVNPHGPFDGTLYQMPEYGIGYHAKLIIQNDTVVASERHFGFYDGWFPEENFSQ
jgi:hypothetical protein